MIEKCLKDFGVRLQYSVFICRLDADGIARCRERLMKVLKMCRKEKEPGDSLIIFERFNPEITDCLLGEQIDNKDPLFAIF
jgi:CRISPR/Cas system-associated endoribonuclease Cas2